MNGRIRISNHPYATIVTVVFLFSLLVTAVTFFGLIPGVGTTQGTVGRLLLITGVLFVATAGSWIAAIGLRAGDS
jgi:hypothetical protein